MKLGKLIKNLKRFEESAGGWPVKIIRDGELFYPGEIHSYRGYYDQLSIDPHGVHQTVKEFLVDLESSVGKEFEGYKGGEFKMTEDTPVWVSEYGRSEDYKICEVVQIEDYIAIKTFEDSYE